MSLGLHTSKMMGLLCQTNLVLLFPLIFHKIMFLPVFVVSDESLKMMDSELKFSTWLNSVINSNMQNSTLIHVAPSKQNLQNTNWYSYQIVIPGVSD